MIGRAGQMALARSGVSAALIALLAGLWVLSFAPRVAAATPSPGCKAWDALGVAGIDGEQTTIDGPFTAGETLKVTVDPATSGLVSFTGDEPNEVLFFAEQPARLSHTLEQDEAAVGISTQGENPGHWVLTHFSCVSQLDAPPTSTAAAPDSAPATGLNVAWLTAVGAAGAMLALHRTRRAAANRPR